MTLELSTMSSPYEGPRQFLLWVDVVGWYDGDTFYGIVDQGFWTYRGQHTKPVRCRCALIAAPELHQVGGAVSRDGAVVIAPPSIYAAWSYKPDPDNFGRPLLDLILPDGRLFSEAMLQMGYAEPYKR